MEDDDLEAREDVKVLDDIERYVIGLGVCMCISLFIEEMRNEPPS